MGDTPTLTSDFMNSDVLMRYYSHEEQCRGLLDRAQRVSDANVLRSQNKRDADWGCDGMRVTYTVEDEIEKIDQRQH